MSNRVAVFVDVGNQFYCVGKKWNGRKLDYRTYLEKATEGGKILHRAFAYGTQVGESAVKFVQCLKFLGYNPRYRTIERGMWYEWCAGMSIEMVRHQHKVDGVVLGSSNVAMVHVVKFLQEQGISVKVVGCGIARELKEAADTWSEITEDMLEDDNSNSTK